MQKAKFEVEGYAVEQREADFIKKGEKIPCAEDLCIVMLPDDWKNHNVIVIKGEKIDD